VQLDKQVRKSLRRNGSCYGRTIAKENRRSVTSFALPENRHSMGDLICDVIGHCGWSCDMGSL